MVWLWQLQLLLSWLLRPQLPSKAGKRLYLQQQRQEHLDSCPPTIVAAGQLPMIVACQGSQTMVYHNLYMFDPTDSHHNHNLGIQSCQATVGSLG